MGIITATSFILLIIGFAMILKENPKGNGLTEENMSPAGRHFKPKTN